MAFSTARLNSVQPSGLRAAAPRRRAAPASRTVAPRAASNLIDTAKEAGSFQTLLAALDAAGACPLSCPVLSAGGTRRRVRSSVEP